MKDESVFDLLIGRATGDEYPVTVVESPAGETETAVMTRLTPYDEEIQETLEQLADRDIDGELLEWLGSEFFEQLFTGRIAELYRASLAIVQEGERRLRVRLRIDSDAAELVTLPWELLYDIHARNALGVAADVDLVRHFPVRKPTRPTRVEPPLKVLLVLSNPDGVPPLNVAAEREIVEQAIAREESLHPLQLEVIERATPERIADALRTFQPHIFHFVGHGMNDGGQGHAVLEDDAGQPLMMDEGSFRELFALGKELRLVLLNACQSATVAGGQSLNGLAPALLQRRISAVVAMQYELSDSAAISFAREFYRSIASGEPVDSAVSSARRSIFLELGRDAPDWATPVLYLRARDGHLFELESAQPSEVAVPPPPAPTPPPRIPDFVGRIQEKRAYRRKLDEEGIAVIAGMVGVGKSALGAQIASEFGADERVFWHSFHVGDGVETLIWRLAGFLAWNQRPAVWEMLQKIVLNGGQLPPPEMLLDYLFQTIRGENYLICLDNFELVEEDRLWEPLADRLRSQVLDGDVKLLIVAGQVPRFVRVTRHLPLEGLSADDSSLLLEQRDVRLDANALLELHARTGGNAELLTLAAEAMNRHPDPQRIIARLISSGDVERYLLDQVDNRLDESERNVMSGVSILLGQPSGREIIEEVLDGENVRRSLTQLTNRYLLHEIDDPIVDRAYVQHSVLQTFYYELLSRRERREMHRRAADWFLDEEEDELLAAFHLFHAGTPENALRLITPRFGWAINAGRSRLLADLLSLLAECRLEPALLFDIRIGLAKLHAFWGETETAKRLYLELLEQSAALADAETRRLQISAGLGELLRQAAPDEALSWLQKGLDEIGEEGSPFEAEMRVTIGTIHMWLGRYDEADQALNRALTLLPETPSQSRVTALENLGVVAVVGRGELNRGIELTEQALAMSRQIQDHFKSAEILSTLAAFQFNADDWSGAVDTLHEALNMAHQLGSDSLLGQIYINLGVVGIDATPEKYSDVEEHLQKGLALVRKTDQRIFESIALTNLAELMIRQERWAEASVYVDQADVLATQLEDEAAASVILQCRAQIALGVGDGEAALGFINEGIELLRDGGEPIELGIALRIRGRILVELADFSAARAAFEESIVLLKESSPSEFAQSERELSALRNDSGGTQRKVVGR